MSKTVSMEDKMHYICMHATVYAILHRHAGWGFQFYEPPEVVGQSVLQPVWGVLMDVEMAGPVERPDWRNFLHVYDYHQTFKRAVNAEYARLGGV